VSVNTTAADLLDDDLAWEVADALAQTKLPPSALVLELTESSVLIDPARIPQNLERLAELGVGLSLDDFGTGYSSLSHLKTLPVTEIKIDQSFVTPMTGSPTIVRATIELARALGKRTVAEGIEDPETWRLLTDAGCSLIQGNALSPPLPPEQLEPLLRRQARRLAARPSAAAA
jgi:EAL domain-containing protein (putative c-di-GMP-specific phosphodiesterase class I)